MQKTATFQVKVRSDGAINVPSSIRAALELRPGVSVENTIRKVED